MTNRKWKMENGKAPDPPPGPLTPDPLTPDPPHSCGAPTVGTAKLDPVIPLM